MRYAVNFAYYAGLVAVPSLFDLFLHVQLSLYTEIAFAFVYVLGISEIVSGLLGGVSNEQTFRFPYPFDLIFNTVPRVFEKNRWTLHGKVIEADSLSGRHVVKLGWGRWAATMTINLNKLDGKTTKVNVLCESSRFFDFGSTRRMTDIFLRELHASLTTQ